jgi:hypothetical protein
MPMRYEFWEKVFAAATRRCGSLTATVYRFNIRRRSCDLQLGRMPRLVQDHGLCLFASCT